MKNQGKVTIHPYCEKPIKTTVDGFKYYIQSFLRDGKIHIGLDVYDANVGPNVYYDSPTVGQCRDYKAKLRYKMRNNESSRRRVGSITQRKMKSASQKRSE